MWPVIIMGHRNVCTSAHMRWLATEPGRALMGCADPPSKWVSAPHQCPRVYAKRLKWLGSRAAVVDVVGLIHGTHC